MLATIVTYELVLLQFDSEPAEQVEDMFKNGGCQI
jgi:hypothetical protein